MYLNDSLQLPPPLGYFWIVSLVEFHENGELIPLTPTAANKLFKFSFSKINTSPGSYFKSRFIHQIFSELYHFIYGPSRMVPWCYQLIHGRNNRWFVHPIHALKRFNWIFWHRFWFELKEEKTDFLLQIQCSVKNLFLVSSAKTVTLTDRHLKRMTVIF